MFGFGGGGGNQLDVLNASGAPKQIAMPGAMQKIAEQDEMFIKQRMSKLEALCSCWEAKKQVRRLQWQWQARQQDLLCRGEDRLLLPASAILLP